MACGPPWPDVNVPRVAFRAEARLPLGALKIIRSSPGSVKIARVRSPTQPLRDQVFQDLSVTFSFTSATLRRAEVRTVSPAAFVAVLATSAAERAASAALL